jgi:type I restriction enzyme S subunit
MNPELRFKDQDGNDFPDWEEKKIKEIGRVTMCKRIFKDQTLAWGEIPFFKIGTFGDIPDAYITRELFEDFKKKYPYPQNGNILISASGSIGKLVEYNGEDAYFQDSNIIWLEHKNDVLDKYLKQIYSTLNWEEGLEGSTIKRLYNKVFLNKVIFLPQVLEQSKIATLLSDIDKKIESQATLVEKLKNTKDAMLVKMFPQGESKVPEIRFDGFSGDWKKIDVRYLINEAIIEKPMDGNHGEKHPVSSEYVEDGIPFLMASDVKDGKVDLDNCKFISKSRAEKLDKGFARNNDVLLTHKATIGETAILTGLNTEYAMLTPQVTYYRIIDNKKLNHFYLYSAFMSKQFQKDIHIAATQSTRSYIGIVKQHKLKIWFPIDIQEQEKIGQFFSNLDKEIEINQQKCEKLCDVKKALLSKLFPTKEDE